MPHVLLNDGVTQAVYRRRWFILASVALLNASNAMIWNSFSTVAGLTRQFYDISFADVNRLSTVFLIISVPVGFLSIWGIDHFGMRASLNVAAGCNAVGALLRLLTVASFLPSEARYPMLLCGQCISALAQSFAMSAPAKVAQNWFPDRQRAMATTLGAMANALGVLASAIISPLVVQTPNDIPILHILYTIPACLTFLVMLLSLNRSKPRIPPSVSSNIQREPFCKELLQIVKNKMYILLMVCSGIGVAIVTALTALAAQILCPKGYGDVFSGVIVALMIGLGLVTSLFTSVLADRTGFLQEIAKICFLIATPSLALFVVVLASPYNPVGVGAIIGVLGIFGFGQYPITLELAVETAYPVGEATSTGLIVIWGYIGSAVLVIALQALGIPVSDTFGTCGTEVLQDNATLDYTYGTILLASLACVACVIVVVFYRCPYRRRRAEKESHHRQTDEPEQTIRVPSQVDRNQSDDTQLSL